MKEKIAIIGAGIGGLTTALALKKAGFKPVIYESASEIQPVGAGIVMANNAMQIFEKLGVREKIENAGNRISSLEITNASLKPILEIDLRKFESRYGVHNVAIHRADLQRILAEEVGFDSIRLSKRLAKIEKNEEFQLSFEDGSTAFCDVLIGADGIHSVVRKQFFNSGKIRDTGQRCWRGVVKSDEDFDLSDETFEAWGKGKRFGASKINKDYLYWFAVIDEELMKKRSLAELFQEFHPKILNLISKTSEEDIVFNDIIDLKPISRWQKDLACLIGDAAHATTPNMGQGACQAVEDAFLIGELLKEGNSFNRTFELYESIRREKAHYVVNTSWKLGKAAHFQNNILIWLRNLTLSSMPQWVKDRQLNKVFDIGYLESS